MEQDAGIISTLDIQSPPLKPPLITTPGCLNTQIKEIALSGIVQNFDMPNILVTKQFEYNIEYYIFHLVFCLVDIHGPIHWCPQPVTEL